MAGQRPPPRRPVPPATQGTMQNIRESSRSPAFNKPRPVKSHPTSNVSAAMQILAASNAAQPSAQAQQQPSPPSSINSRRSPPPAQAVQRLLPTPPRPPPANPTETPEGPSSPSVPSQNPHNQSNLPIPHYPRPIHRVAVPQHNFDTGAWKVANEHLADIERADLQQSQVNSSNSYSASYLQNQQPNSPPKDHLVERFRAAERSSPKEPDTSPQRRQQAARESPKVRERQQLSPTVPLFPKQPPSQSPERRASPTPYQGGLVTNDLSSGFISYTREPPAALRRPTNAPLAPIPVDSRPLLASLATQTPPLQTINTRTPDRSLPVQEIEDEPAKNGTGTGTGTRQTWQEINDGQQHVRHTASPTPSSFDVAPESKYIDRDNNRNGRSSRNGHREESSSLPLQQESSAGQREHIEEENGGFTPRSPTAELPEDPSAKYYSSPHNVARPAQSQPPRRQTRNGPTDQLGLRSFDPADFEGDGSVLVMNSDIPQYTEPRRQQQASLPPQPQPEHHDSHQYAEQSQSQAQYRQQKILPDEMPPYDPSFLQSYYQSPRPNAPIPPTPHSQTAAPSPSPLLTGHYQDHNQGHPPFSPILPVGSPYPYPFNHVRRPQTFNGPNRLHVPTSHNTPDLNNIQEQLARQWGVYARNQYGNVSDSTFSPSSTPFEGADFTPWALHHTNRTLGRPQDMTSMRSSPSHELLEPPVLPPALGVKKSRRSTVLRRHQSNRKPPPRVDSTQPRDTSSESSSSGEETAGDERFGNTEDGNWSGGTIAPIPIAGSDDKDEWVDEENDEDDLLELEYHQSYVNNVEKRRRRWEVGWEAVIQAIQTLDRHTDATVVLMAAPSHSTKLYSATSRSVRRQSGTAANALAMKEMRGAFSRIAAQRRTSRSHKSSLVDRFLFSSASSGNGSDGSTESREVDLKRVLEAALGSLASLRDIYGQREARWIEEMRRVAEDRERVELLLKQVLGDSNTSTSSTLSVASPTMSPS
ncbi:hypothetical protein C0992_013339 [Termitomyces sp. T32_za158]|nr:hypothetical protein C0992_013339 [Termitomyces sp. T32_za158]